MQRARLLAVVAAAAGIFAAAAVALLPAYLSGDGSETTLATNGDSALAALAAFLLLAAAPSLAPEPSFRWLVWVCGLALVAASFLTVVAVYFIPSGLALLAASWVSDRRQRG